MDHARARSSGNPSLVKHPFLLDEAKRKVASVKKDGYSGSDRRSSSVSTNRAFKPKLRFRVPDGSTPIDDFGESMCSTLSDCSILKNPSTRSLVQSVPNVSSPGRRKSGLLSLLKRRSHGVDNIVNSNNSKCPDRSSVFSDDEQSTITYRTLTLRSFEAELNALMKTIIDNLQLSRLYSRRELVSLIRRHCHQILITNILPSLSEKMEFLLLQHIVTSGILDSNGDSFFRSGKRQHQEELKPIQNPVPNVRKSLQFRKHTNGVSSTPSEDNFRPILSHCYQQPQIRNPKSATRSISMDQAIKKYRHSHTTESPYFLDELKKSKPPNPDINRQSVRTHNVTRNHNKYEDVNERPRNQRTTSTVRLQSAESHSSINHDIKPRGRPSPSAQSCVKSSRPPSHDPPQKSAINAKTSGSTPADDDNGILQCFYVKENTYLDQLIDDNDDRRIASIVNRHGCSIRLYGKSKKGGHHMHKVIVQAPNSRTLRICVRALDLKMNWDLTSQLPKYKSGTKAK